MLLVHNLCEPNGQFLLHFSPSSLRAFPKKPVDEVASQMLTCPKRCQLFQLILSSRKQFFFSVSFIHSLNFEGSLQTPKQSEMSCAAINVETFHICAAKSAKTSPASFASRRLTRLPAALPRWYGFEQWMLSGGCLSGMVTGRQDSPPSGQHLSDCQDPVKPLHPSGFCKGPKQNYL